MCRALFVGLSPGLQKTMIFDSFTVNEVSRCSEYFLDASGKCINSARVFAQLGGYSLCLTQVGGENENKLLSLADESGVNICPVRTIADVRYCYTIIDRTNHTATELVVNEPGSVEVDIEKTFIEKYSKLVAEYDAVVITGSRLPGFSDIIIPELVSIAKKAAKFVFADYRNEDLNNSFISRTVRPDFVKLNMDEFKETFHDNNDGFDVDNKLQKLSRDYNNTFIITQGAGQTLFAESGKIGSFIPEKVTPVNAIGCGDAFLAGLVMGILKNNILEEAMKLGSECAKKNALNIRPGNIRQ